MRSAPFICAALIFCSVAYGVPRESPAPAELALDGTWLFKTAEIMAGARPVGCANDPSWKQIRVPANWHSEGYDLSGAVWYCRTFRLAERNENSRIQLLFEGIDYAADVWLNGELLGSHEGYFEPFDFDVSERISFSGENTLLVLVHSPVEEVGPIWSLHKQLIKGVYGQHDTRPGGAWSSRGQEQNTGGIWAPVRLHFSNAIGIASVRAVPHPSESSGALTDGMAWTLNSDIDIYNPGTQARVVSVRVDASPANFTPIDSTGGANVLSFSLAPGVNHLHSQLECSNVYLWWSWDRGLPNLYRVTAEVLSAGKILDQRQDVVGFRTIEVTSAEKQWRLNGKRIFLRGTNYISTQWLGEMTREKYDFDAGLMRRANVNAIRVHAHVEAPEFYEACDEAGMLVWQDFPLQWGYSDAPEFESEAVHQALAMVRLLGGHPSIIGWTMHNEPPWDAPWMQYKYKDYDPQQNKRLDERLTQAVSEFDPTRFTHDHSATAEHPWLGWYSGSWQDYGKPTTQAFITEFGAQALPNLPELRKIFGDENLWPDSDSKWDLWDYHNFEKHETFDLAHVAMGDSPEEFVRNTQDYQSQLVQFAAESYRRQRYQPVSAIFQFMFVEDWPSVNWGVVDYWREPKPGYSALATAYQPVLPSIAWTKNVWKQDEPVKLDVWVINDLEDSFPSSRLTVALLRRGKSPEPQVVFLDIPPDSGKKVISLSWRNLTPGSYDVSAQIEDSSERVLGTNRFSFQVTVSTGVASK